MTSKPEVPIFIKSDLSQGGSAVSYCLEEGIDRIVFVSHLVTC